MNILLLEASTPFGGTSPPRTVCSTLLQVPQHNVRWIDPLDIYSHAGQRGLYRTLIEYVQESAIDVIIYALGREFAIHPLFIKKHLGSCLRVLHVSDDETLFDLSHRYYAQAFDLVLTTNPLIERYQTYGINALYAGGGFDRTTFPVRTDRNRTRDVSFIGSLVGKPGRQDAIEALTRNGFHVDLYGYGTPAGVVSDEERAAIYHQSRINLNLTRINFSTPYERASALNQRIRAPKGRCQEAAMCGSFVLSEYAPGIERVFEIGTEIDVFRSDRELVEKVSYYLKNEDVRESMALRAHQRALREYEAVAFWSDILNKLAEQRNQHRKSAEPIMLDRSFLAAFGAYRIEYAVFFMFCGQWRFLFRELMWLFRHPHLNIRFAIWHARLGLAWASRSSRFAEGFRKILIGIRACLRAFLRVLR